MFRLKLLLLIVAFPVISVNGDDALQWSGFTLARAASNPQEAPFFDSALSSQLHLGLDWRPSVLYGAHAGLVARSDPQQSQRGAIGVVEAYVEAIVPHGDDERFRVLAGAFFLPTSRENVDALWENPYAISSSALNTWFGEEFRPIGVDVSWSANRAFLAGVTVFRGNETFGAFPIDRGWAIRDHWAVLGEHLRVDDEYDASVSAENDGALGWAGRTRWNNEEASLQYTYIDNRADGLEYGHLLNWDTQFHVLAGDVLWRDWTFASEAGWGVTSVNVDGTWFASDIGAAYALASRRLSNARVTLRQDWYYVDDERQTATTLALFWTPPGAWRPGLEVSTAGGTTRVLAEVRYYFRR
jgi:hypothetical protein